MYFLSYIAICILDVFKVGRGFLFFSHNSKYHYNHVMLLLTDTQTKPTLSLMQSNFE